MNDQLARIEMDLEELRPKLQELARAIREIAAVFADRMEPFMRALGEFVAEAKANAMQMYLAEGAPYGPTEEGMMRWVKEKTEIERLRWQARQIEEHHRMLADFRRQLGKSNE